MSSFSGADFGVGGYAGNGIQIVDAQSFAVMFGTLTIVAEELFGQYSFEELFAPL